MAESRRTSASCSWRRTIASATARGSTRYEPSSIALTSAGSTLSIVPNNLITAADVARVGLASIRILLEGAPGALVRACGLVGGASVAPGAPSIGVADPGGENYTGR